MKVKYENKVYDTLKEAFEEFLIDMGCNDVDFPTKKEAYDYFRKNEVKRVKEVYFILKDKETGMNLARSKTPSTKEYISFFRSQGFNPFEVVEFKEVCLE